MEDQGRAAGDAGSSSAADRRARSRGPGKRIRSGLVELLVVVVGALLVSALLRAFVGQMFIIPTGSMEDTILPKDRVVASKVSDFHRGSIVVFKDTGGWIPTKPPTRSPLGRVGEFIGVLPATSSNHLIKRVIGMPGDHVSASGGKVSVNGQVLDERSYVKSVSGAASDFDFDVVVPAGHVFVMGDHRDESGDSRCHLRDEMPDGQPTGADAFVPVSAIEGPAVAVAMPLGRMRTFHTPGTFTAVPAPGAAPAVARISVTNPTCG